MRTTTDYVTNVMVPVAATASRNAATAQESTLATKRLARGIEQIDSTARAVRAQAAELELLVGRFIIDEPPARSAAQVFVGR
jgi:hypothetical protein